MILLQAAWWSPKRSNAEKSPRLCILRGMWYAVCGIWYDAGPRGIEVCGIICGAIDRPWDHRYVAFGIYSSVWYGTVDVPGCMVWGIWHDMRSWNKMYVVCGMVRDRGIRGVWGVVC